MMNPTPLILSTFLGLSVMIVIVAAIIVTRRPPQGHPFGILLVGLGGFLFAATAWDDWATRGDYVVLRLILLGSCLAWGVLGTAACVRSYRHYGRWFPKVEENSSDHGDV